VPYPNQRTSPGQNILGCPCNGEALYIFLVALKRRTAAKCQFAGCDQLGGIRNVCGVHSLHNLSRTEAIERLHDGTHIPPYYSYLQSILSILRLTFTTGANTTIKIGSTKINFKYLEMQLHFILHESNLNKSGPRECGDSSATVPSPLLS
jgi:hypothetical protein